MYSAYPGQCLSYQVPTVADEDAGQYGQYGAPGAMQGGGSCYSFLIHDLTNKLLAPGTGAPPGMSPTQADPHQSRSQQGYQHPQSFQPPPNMPNINFAAPVIRLGAPPVNPNAPPTGPGDRDRGGPRRPGLGAGPGDGGYRDRERERPQPIQPQSKEEIIRTLFVGGITDGCGGDEGIERILRAPGGLRRWFRAVDGEDKPQKFGFAEYEDPESLEVAIEVLKGIMVPVKPRPAEAENGEADGEIEKSLLLIVADENSKTYLEQWEESQGGVDMAHKQMLLDQAQDALQAVLADLENPQAKSKDQAGTDRDGDTTMGEENADGDVVTIQLNADDELSDIPAEMRETVAKEIAAFRDRSNRRDLERLKREEEIELQERTRMMNGNRSRMGSPPAGPAAIPSGPRGAPAGPKGSGFPKDYAKGVTFVNGTGVSASSAFEDEDTDASDEELERRRQEKKNSETEKDFLDQERRWLNRERSRTAAVEREKNRDQEEDSRNEGEKAAMAKRLKEWDDDLESSRKEEEYYRDRSMWIRNRASFRQRELANDDADRSAEQRDRARDSNQRERAGQMADDFLSRQGDILSQSYDEPSTPTDSTRREPARFKLSLGAAAQKAQAASQAAAASAKRPVTDVEGMLEDEEDTSAQDRRKLIPIPASQLESAKAQAQDMTDEERASAAQALAAEIPTDKDALWAWDVNWTYLDSDIIEDRLRPFVEKKIVEYLGVQEQMVVDVVMGALGERRAPRDLVRELEGALDEEEADALVRKLWRMVVFFSESGRRGLGA